MKTLNGFLIIAMVFGAFTLNTPKAEACSWLFRTPIEKMENADLVVKGVVTSFSTTTKMVDGVLTDVNTIVITPDTYWKGNPTETVTVTSSFASGTSCYPARAEVGYGHIIFAKSAPNGYTINELDIETVDANNHETLKALGAGTPIGQQPPAMSGLCMAFSKNIMYSQNGSDVSVLQTKLLELGYRIPAITNGTAAKGYFGNQTRAALRQYQKKLGLPQTGNFDPNTQGRVFAMFCSKTQLPPMK